MEAFPGEVNPADLGSPGVIAEKLKDSKLWWKVPDWFSGSKEDWLEIEEVKETEESLTELKKVGDLV